ncbi:MAG: metal-dependent hydrolase [Candidatus Azotimanducaceae bacterium WSBS_2022_MAG_OTU7]
MDPISQGSLGAALAQGGSNPEKVKAATLLGCFGGLAPDLDIFIFSPTDPLLFLEFHRQFTHSLIFIPFGALLVALVMHQFLGKRLFFSERLFFGKRLFFSKRLFFGKRLRFRESYLFCLLGFATHGLLDTCTTYGTQLLWPFTNERFAWNNVSIIDPLFTIPIVCLVIVGVYRKQPWFGRTAFAWAICYLLIGVYQRDRAIAAGYELAATRGHEPIRLEAKPGFANLILWKVVYETEDSFFVDGIRVGIDNRFFPGDNAEKLNLDKHFTWLDPTSQQAKDVERFRWFSNNYLAIDPTKPERVIDVRYSVVPNEIQALWAIDLDRSKPDDAHIDWIALRRTDSAQTQRWWSMLINEH